ncbi:hypothetical protein scyTo_0009916 [Scyliorhinus torazame]|uniref:VWFD domain-containing protein n=1 Tax=Scyliorhinus torazame TaxID=75743 RepID=A0A401NW46_SCYTO|nr:hypothetical protein [Scyliorhinus torazame]
MVLHPTSRRPQLGAFICSRGREGYRGGRASGKPGGAKTAGEYNETWLLCECLMATCIEKNIISITSVVCPTVEPIKCVNGHEPVKVYDENRCCFHYECDCYCNGWGGSHFVTFDGQYYTYEGNCTYILVEETRASLDNFGIYVDNYHCDAQDGLSCSRVIIVKFEKLDIEITNVATTGLQHLVTVDGITVSLPYSRDGVKIASSGIDIMLEIPKIKALVTFNGLSFAIKLPSEIFGNNTQGQCECHNRVSPDHYYQACVRDECQTASTSMVCASLQTYATVCMSHGICIDWRSYTNGACSYNCPLNKVYKACEHFEGEHTCTSSNSDLTGLNLSEGCFCPEGTTLFSPDTDLCVNKCGCIGPDGLPKEFDERFEFNCQDCICDKITHRVICQPHNCRIFPTMPCEGEGFININITIPNDDCCTKTVCRCNSNLCSPTEDRCDLGFKIVPKIPDGHCCPVYTCDQSVQLIPPGGKWPSPYNNCTVYGCIQIDDSLISTSSKHVCPDFHPEDCEPVSMQELQDKYGIEIQL